MKISQFNNCLHHFLDIGYCTRSGQTAKAQQKIFKEAFKNNRKLTFTITLNDYNNLWLLGNEV